MNIERGIKDTIISSEQKIDYLLNIWIQNGLIVFFRMKYIGYLKSKYNKTYLDAIIVSDDFALNSLVEYGNDVFPNIPIVAVGINNSVIDLKSIKKNNDLL